MVSGPGEGAEAAAVEWRDEGVILAVHRHGEAAAVVDLLTREHGRHAGLVHGGNSRRWRGSLQPGNQVTARWRSRLVEQLGTYACELERARAAALFHDRTGLAAISAVCALCEMAVAERAPCREIFDGVVHFLDVLGEGDAWPAAYVRWEVALLSHLGFGLDLTCCAITGRTDGLAYVSPRTGRAVVAAVAESHRHRLLPLPSFLAGDDATAVAPHDISQGLAITGHFLDRHVLRPHGRALPLARSRLLERLASIDTTSGEVGAP